MSPFLTAYQYDLTSNYCTLLVAWALTSGLCPPCLVDRLSLPSAARDRRVLLPPMAPSPTGLPLLPPPPYNDRSSPTDWP